MNIIQLYQDYNITYRTEGNSHCRPGWVQVDCPFCAGEPNMHLGCNIDTGHFSCWRCGWKPADIVISKLLGVTKQEASRILKDYKFSHFHKAKEIKPNIRLKSFRMPSNTTKLQTNHKIYLERRGFDPDRLEKEWGIMGTGVVSKLDNIDYKHRIIIPISWGGSVVSFQARDITNKSELRYITCPKDRELIFHKSILFGNQKQWTSFGIIVEGVFDVFRFGHHAAATFGIKYTPEQIRLIAKTFEKVAVIFDGEEKAAASQANKLIAELKYRNIPSHRIDITGDPADMKQDEADYLVKSLIYK